MKAKLDFKSKRTIIIASIIAVLAVGAGVGGYFYAKGNNQAGAANIENGTSQNVSVDQGNSTKNSDNKKEDNKNPDNKNDNNNGEDNGNADNGNTADNGTDNDNTNNGNAANNANNNANNNGNANGGNAANNGGANNGNAEGNGGANNGAQDAGDDTDATTVIETVTDLNPWESHSVRWTPEALKVSTPNVDVNKPKLEIEKTAYVKGESLEGKPVNTVAQKGEDITFVIRIKNTGKLDASKVMVYDTIPEGTTLKENKEGTLQTVKDANGKETQRIVWEKDVKAGETISVSFIVTVNVEEDEKIESINLIENKAKVNKDETNITKTPVITSKKVATLIEGEDEKELKNNVDSVKPGQTIRYTISAKNDTEVDGVTKITDTVPEGTTLVEKSLDDKVVKTEKEVDGKKVITLEWKNVEVKAKKTTSVSFEVTVNKERTTKIRNVATVGETETPPTETTVANISTRKVSEKSHTPLKEWDTITYKLIATNIGDGKGTVVLSDEIPTGTVLDGKIIVENDENEYTEKDLKNGIEVEVEAGKERTLTFKVKVLPFKVGDENVEEKDGKVIRTIVNAEAKQDGKEIPKTEDPVEKEFIKVSGEKKWKDYNNQENTRPGKITVEVLNGEEVVDTIEVVPDESGNWKYESIDLPKYASEEDVEPTVYTVREKDTDNKYTASVSKEDKRTITNTLKDTPKVKVSGEKKWEDYNNQENTRPGKITVEVLNGEKVVDTIEVKADKDGKWKYESKELPKYANKEATEPITYTVKEIKVDGYTTNVATPVKDDNGNEIINVTNTLENTPTVKVSGTKIWEDYNNQEGTRKDNIVIVLESSDKNDTTERKVTVGKKEDGTYDWTYEFANLPKYANKEATEPITYTVKEIKVDGYTTNVADPVKDDNGNETINVTNTLENTPTVKVSGTKIWKDYNNQEGTRKDNIVIVLESSDKNDTTERKVTVGKKEDGTYDWTYEFANLPKYANKEATEPITYTVKEIKVDGYTTNVATPVKDDNGNETINVTNTLDNTPKVKVSGTKIWEDYNNQEGTRKDNIVIVLESSDKNDTTERKVTVGKKEDGTYDWTYEFTNLPKYANKEATEPITYTVNEIEVDGYTTNVATPVKDDNGNEIINVTNTLENTPTVKVSGEKKWEDYNNQEGTRKDNIVIVLESSDKNDTTERKVTVGKKEDGTYDWTYEFANLPKYANKEATEPITYTVKEIKVDGYTTNVADPVKDDNGNEIINVTNTLENTPTVKVSGTKIWEDYNNQEGTRKDNIVIVLESSDKNDTTERKVTVGKKEDGTYDWTYEFANLPKYANKEATEPITYTVKEIKVDGYTTNVATPVKDDNGNETINVTNTLDNTPKVKVSGTKIWEDYNNQEGTRKDNIVIVLESSDKNDTTERKVTVGKKEDGTYDWTYEFTNLPKYANKEATEPITYTVNEIEVDGYTTNVATPVKDDNGNEIINVTNTLENTPTVKVSGEKKWEDYNNQEGTRKDNIVIVLESSDKNDTTERKVTVGKKEDGTYDWTYEFANLPKYANKEATEPITYTVKEIKVDGYTTNVADPVKDDNGNEIINVTNTLENTPTVKVSGTKIWEDYNNQEGTRKDNIVIVLESSDKNDTTERKVTVGKKEDGTYDWTYEFANLPKYANKEATEPITYTVKEIKVDGYTTSVATPVKDNNGNETINVTNTLKNTPTVKVSGTKIWKDFDNKYDSRPDNIVIVLESSDKNDTTERTATIGKKEDGTYDWTYKFENLPKYDSNNALITYTVHEVEVDKYISGLSDEEKDNNGNSVVDITNRYKNARITRKSLASTETSTEEENVDVDVVFVLDISGSMDDDEQLIDGTGWVYKESTPISFNYIDWRGRERTYYFEDENDPPKGIDPTKIEFVNGKWCFKKGITIRNVSYSWGNVSITMNTSTNQHSNAYSSYAEFKTPQHTDKAKMAVDALNKAIHKILEKNSNNRVGVVAYSSSNGSDNSKVLLPLGRYTANSGNDYLKFTLNLGVGNDQTEPGNDTITVNVNGENGETVTVKGGTYTQAGIKKGAELLTKEDADDVEGKVPVMILLTDGEPTVSNTNPDLTGSTIGNGSTSSSEYNKTDFATRTKKTAAYYKKQIKDVYGLAQFFTIGYNLSDNTSKDMLNPSSGTFNFDDETYNYAYADASFTGEMDEARLDQILSKIIETTTKTYKEVENISTSNIDMDEILVELKSLDITHDLTIKLDGAEVEKEKCSVEYLMSDSVKAIIYKEDKKKYYLDLTADMFKEAQLIDVTYFDTLTANIQSEDYGESTDDDNTTPVDVENPDENGVDEENTTEPTNDLTENNLTPENNLNRSSAEQKIDSIEEIENNVEDEEKNIESKNNDEKTEKQDVNEEKSSSPVENNKKEEVEENTSIEKETKTEEVEEKEETEKQDNKEKEESSKENTEKAEKNEKAETTSTKSSSKEQKKSDKEEQETVKTEVTEENNN